ncbi:flagellar hook-basal body complex protein FliE [Paenibacillus sp. KQZ6P-2]|uniref:Flagellar hook-basal body complex protein FliE n=1 Tax=Paenibacillus mangrovi TaxID=2931978 RepID=A0A9X1WKC7_9BACL|nr:flagellar hook-basal body complex protein FliE [Paenibacillus mangrovi]MCJ8010598.1 flagellar hook-basal body complex protein FliE [Paenibacillus mangrovi]
MIQNTMFPTQAVQPLKMKESSQSDATPAESLNKFSSYLKDAIDQVAEQENASKEMNDKFTLGQANIDEVMIASEKALLSLQLTAQVRNKVIEAYQEIMRTQI